MDEHYKRALEWVVRNTDEDGDAMIFLPLIAHAFKVDLEFVTADFDKCGWIDNDGNPTIPGED
jgi:hypothetical protein